jgi:hypothetical protein
MVIHRLRHSILGPSLTRSSKAIANKAITAISNIDRDLASQDITTAVISALSEPSTQAAILERQNVLQAIREEMNNGKGLVRLRAAEMLGKLPAVDLWEERQQPQTESQDPAELRHAIRVRLLQLLNEPLANEAIVDIEASSAT